MLKRLLLAAPLCFLSIAANAAEKPAPLYGFISEVSGGLALQDVFRPERLKQDEKNTAALTLEALSTPLFTTTRKSLLWRILLQPQAHLGGSLSLAGYTSLLYSGLTWGHQFSSGAYTRASFGLALHNGELNYKDDPALPGLNYIITGRPQLGSAVLFREGLEVGYRWQGGHGLGLQISHMSHAGLFDEQNDGMTFLSLRYSYKFN